MLKSFKTIFTFLIISLVIISTGGIFCSCKSQTEPKTINMFNTRTNKIEKLDFNTYLEGVVNAEIGEEAPEEVLKTQAVLARTFALNFLKNNKSKYKNADISNDITEAQAYKPSISSKIKKAVKDTSKIVLKCNNQYIKPLFFANSGGITATANEGLNLDSYNYPYIKSVKSPETNENSSSFSWTATISKNQILNATRNMGLSLANVSSFSKGEIGESGRCKTFIIGGKEVDANTFRLQIGSTVLKSTLIKNISVSNSSVTFTGNGYGHGVGVSQEGAIILANQGKSFKDILNYYFSNIKIVKE